MACTFICSTMFFKIIKNIRLGTFAIYSLSPPQVGLTGECNFGVCIATKTEVFINFINDFCRAIAIFMNSITQHMPRAWSRKRFFMFSLDFSQVLSE